MDTLQTREVLLNRLTDIEILRKVAFKDTRAIEAQNYLAALMYEYYMIKQQLMRLDRQ